MSLPRPGVSCVSSPSLSSSTIGLHPGGGSSSSCGGASVSNLGQMSQSCVVGGCGGYAVLRFPPPPADLANLPPHPRSPLMGICRSTPPTPRTSTTPRKGTTPVPPPAPPDPNSVFPNSDSGYSQSQSISEEAPTPEDGGGKKKERKAKSLSKSISALWRRMKRGESEEDRAKYRKKRPNSADQLQSPRRNDDVDGLFAESSRSLKVEMNGERKRGEGEEEEPLYSTIRKKSENGLISKKVL